jgi:hypothetical protein
MYVETYRGRGLRRWKGAFYAVRGREGLFCWFSHIETGVELRCFGGLRCGSFAFLWCAVRHHTHIKSTDKEAYRGTGSR